MMYGIFEIVPYWYYIRSQPYGKHFFKLEITYFRFQLKFLFNQQPHRHLPHRNDDWRGITGIWNGFLERWGLATPSVAGVRYY